MLRRESLSEEESEAGPSSSLSAKAAAGVAAGAPAPGVGAGHGGGGGGGQDTPTPGKRRHLHKRHQHHRRSSRLSPEGREREFPATRVGHQQQSSSPPPPPLPPHQQLGVEPAAPERDSEESVSTMGAGDERFFPHQPQPGSGSGGGGGGGAAPPGPGSRCGRGGLGQTADFHYTLQPTSEHHFRPSQVHQARVLRQDPPYQNITQQGAAAAAGYPSPHVTQGGSRVRSGQREGYYLEDGRGGRNKSSPYHHAAARVAAAAAARDPQQPDFYRQQQQQRHHLQQQYEAEQFGLQHISDSRSDLLDHDHNAIYNFGNATTGFISCDGKFIPIPLPTAAASAAAAPSYDIVPSAADYRRAAATHGTLGRRSKRSSLATDSGGGYGSCCPRDAHGGRSGRSGGGGGSAAPMYATLRMRPKKDGRQGAGSGGSGAGGGSGGVGDNYGRNQFAATSVYADDSRSLAGFTDDDFLLPPPPHGHHEALLVAPGGGSGGARIMSRSTDRNLHHHHHHHHQHELSGGGGGGGGGNATDDDPLQLMGNAAAAVLQPMHLASTSDQFLHEREPPDGKEKPEPACKAGGQKMEGNAGAMATLSRKSSKCDLLDQRAAVVTGQPSSSSEAASMSGAESTGAGVIGKGDPAASASAALVGGGNRESLSGAVMKDVVFQMEHSGGGGNAGADQRDVDGAAYSSGKDW